MAGDDLRRLLEQVLKEPRFASPSESAWDRLLARVFNEFVRLLAALVDAVGGPVAAALIALAIVMAVTTWVAVRLAGGRASVIEDRLQIARLVEAGTDPREVLRAAAEASAAGDHSTAIRLRFVGGVLELGAAGRIQYRPGLTSGGIAAQMDDPAFTALAEQFDRVVYGDRVADGADDRRSSELWAAAKAPA